MVEYIFKLEDIPKIATVLLQQSKNHQKADNFPIDTEWWLFISIGIDLCSDLSKLRRLKADIREENKSCKEALIEAISDWITTQNENATLTKFLAILEDNAWITFTGPMRQAFLGEGNGEGPTVTVANNTPHESQSMVAAMSNNVIRKEIFSFLKVNDMKSWRFVCSSWWKESTKLWRKFAWVRIGTEFNPDYDLGKHLTLSDLDELHQQSVQEGEENQEENYNLQVNPYHRFSIRDEFIRPFLPSAMMVDDEFFFWCDCAPMLTHLSLNACVFDGRSDFDVIKHIFLLSCPNLIDFRISTANRNDDDEENMARRIDESNQDFEDLPANASAKNLQRFTYDCLNATVEEKRMLLEFAPKLKYLCIESHDIQAGLLTPASNGTYPQIEELKLESACWTEDQLTGYGLNHLLPVSLKSVDISIQYDGNRPGKLYNSLAECPNLEKLRFDYSSYLSDVDPNPGFHWLVDFSTFTLENLKEFHLTICTSLTHMKFHFSSLLQMPNLQVFSLTYAISGSEDRLEGDADWIFHGPPREASCREKGRISINNFDLPTCGFLREFYFNGWELNRSDLTLLKSWFPFLTYLQATMNGDLLPVVLKLWNLATLHLNARSRASKPELFEAKRKHKNTRIFYDKRGIGLKEVVIREDGTIDLE